MSQSVPTHLATEVTCHEMRAELERLPPASPGHAALTALYDKSTCGRS